MGEEKQHTVSIKKGTVKITAERTDLVNISETPDGVVFNFKGNLSLHLTDLHMPRDMKSRIRTADSLFTVGSLTFDLDNYPTPVVVDTT